MQYVILTLMGNAEDFGREEEYRTTDINEAIAVVKRGARVYEDHSDNGWIAEMPLSPVPDDIDELPF